MKRIHLKPEAAVKGFYYLDHGPTGKVFTGVSNNMQAEVLALKDELVRGVCKHKRLMKQYSAEPDFVVRCLEHSSIKDARKAEKDFRAQLPDNLLLN